MMPRDTNLPPRNEDQKEKSQETGAGSGRNDENLPAAFIQAEKDIQQDPDLSLSEPNDDLDEEETVRLSEDKTNLA